MIKRSKIETNIYFHQYTPEYQKVLSYNESLGYKLPSEPQKRKQDNLIIALKAAGVWSLLDCFQIYATDGDSNFACTNWIKPGSNTAIKNSSPTFTTNKGFFTNGTGNSVNANFAPSQGVNFTQNANSFGYYRWDPSTATIGHVDIGLSEVSRILYCRACAYSTDGNAAYLGSNGDYTSTAATVAPGALNGLWWVSRSSSSSTKMYKNATALYTAVKGTVGLSAYPFGLGGENVSGTIVPSQSLTYGLFFAGKNLDSFASAFSTAINNYLSSL